MAKQIKLLYKGKCQLCQNKIKSTHGYITEAHHIRPYNQTHQGDDTFLNLIVLCPNCHSRFDDFYYAIHPETHLVHSLDESNEHHLKKVYMEKGHNFGEEYLNYAWEIFQNKV